MNRAALRACLCAAILVTSLEAYGDEAFQLDESARSAAASLCARERVLVGLYRDQATWRWYGYLRLDDDWRAQCRMLYTQCKDQSWGFKKGWDCHECFRNCEVQREWPFHLCGPSIKKPQPKPLPKKRRR